MTRHLIIPDVQAKPGNDFTFLSNIGKYIIDKRPDVVVCLGDFADMPSLSSYDIGKKSFEGKRYLKDIEAARDAMLTLMAPIVEFNERQRKNKQAQYKPRFVMTLGNHEYRIERAVENDPKIEGVLDVADLKYHVFGWEVHKFLEVVKIDGIMYSHYFTSGLLGRPVTTARACLNRKHQSCIQGHQQGLQIATDYKADGEPITCIIAGSCYEHDEDYMSAQGNKHWRGIIVLNDVYDGAFDIMPVSLKYLGQKYGTGN